MSSVKVFYRNDRKKFQVTYYLNGVRKRPLFNCKSEADSFARKISLGLSPEDQGAVRIEDAIKRYYENVSLKKSSHSHCNEKRCLNLLYHFMTAERGITRLKSVGLEDVEAFRDWMLSLTEFDGKPTRMGPSTVNRMLAVIKHFFKKNVQWRNITDSPCLYLDLLDAEYKERRAMTQDEYDRMFARVPEWYKPLLQFMRLTGAPPSTIERLTFADIDFSIRTFYLRRKKGAKARWKRIALPMTDKVFAILIKQRNGSAGLDGHVFKDDCGRPMLADRICRIGNKAIRDAGLTHVTLYCLRHALASDLTAAHIPTEIVRQVMGHASISTTQRYANKVGNQVLEAALSLVRGGNLKSIG